MNNGHEAIEERSMKEKRDEGETEEVGTLAFYRRQGLIRLRSSRLPFCKSTLVHSSKATDPLGEEQLQ